MSSVPATIADKSRSADAVPLPLAKLVFDKFLALLLLVATLPLSLLIVVAEFLDGVLHPDHRGPIFHHEVRITQGRPFNLYKFRILKTSAIAEIACGERTPKEIENIPANLTHIGRILKKAGIDEIPQFYSILRGDMSLIGPRPRPIPEYEEELKSGNFQRSRIKAGLTGPAQIMKGTQRTAEDEMRANDEYIEMVKNGPAWKVLATDLALVGKTIRLLFKFTGE